MNVRRKVTGTMTIVAIAIWVCLLMYSLVMAVIMWDTLRDNPVLVLSYAAIFVVLSLTFWTTLIRTKWFESIIS